jgi:branched-chain amino acid transport system substrate-binding protein
MVATPRSLAAPRIVVLAASFLLSSALVPSGDADAAEARRAPTRIAFIDPLSGAFANAGESTLRHFRAAIEANNRRAAAPRFEIAGFDNKASAQESLQALRLAIDQGYRYVVQGQSSAAALALSEAIQRHNEREPARAVVLLNYAALDPDLTNARCSFWHFRFDASSDMRLEALLDALARDRDIRTVYLIGQNYSFGQQVARGARELLARKRPDIRIVGDELHPLGQVKDFAPYAAKIRASGADAVLTGNWGNDLTLLVRAAREAGVTSSFYTFFAGSLGAVTAIGEAGVGRVKQVNEWHANVPNAALERYAAEYRARYREDFYFMRIGTLVGMLAEAIGRAKSDEPLAVARALSGMRYTTPLGEVEMRAVDHQLIQPLYVSTLVPVAARGGPAEVRHDVEGTGLGFRTDARIEGYVTAQPTSCAMKRP